MPDDIILNLLQTALLTAAVALMLTASFNDVAVRAIPNGLSLGVAAIGVALRLIEGSLLMPLAVAAAVFAFGAICWRCGWLGGGDVKLLAACSLLLQPAQVPQLGLATALAGGVLACGYLAIGQLAPGGPRSYAGRERALAVRVCRVESWRARHRRSLPYGCAIAAAVMFTLFTD